MGCAASRTACEGEEIPAKVRPVLHRRFNELRQKKKSSKNDLTDAKKLLRGDQECREIELSSRSSSSQDDSLQQLKQPLLKTEKTSETPKAVAAMRPNIAKGNNAVIKEEEGTHENEHDVKEEKGMKKESNVEKSFGEKAKVAVAEPKEEEEEEEEEEEDDGRLLRKNNDLGDGPGSPSFRFYCVECIDTDDKGLSDDEIDLPNDEVQENYGQEHNSSRNQDISQETTPIISVKDPETNNNVVRKKGKKGRGFGRVMPRAGRAAVKHIWHGKLCYDPSSSSSSHHNNHHQDKTHLLSKPAA